MFWGVIIWNSLDLGTGNNLQRCYDFLMDSANGHIAANYNVAVVSLWGLTHPFAGYAPFMSKNENMLVSTTKNIP